jgi:hypothetical protein
MAIEAISALSNVASSSGSSAIKSVNLTAPGQFSDHGVSGNGVSGAGKASPELNVRFSAAMNRMDQTAPMGSSMPTPVKGMFDALDQVNVQARSVSDYASTAEASGGQLTPGEIVQLTMKCQEFMFQCQLTSNIANRSSDGVQQLFRQQG